MYIRQYRETAAGTKTLTQRVLNADHMIIGRYNGAGVKVTFADPVRYAVEFPLPLEGNPPPIEVYEDGLTDAGLYKNNRLLYHVGGVYTVMHKRGKPSVRRYPMKHGALAPHLICAPQTKAEAQEMDDRGWLPLQIEVVRIRFGRLQAMTDADVIAEGKPTREEYIALWNEINGVKAWDANPLVARIGFKVYEPGTTPDSMRFDQLEEERYSLIHGRYGSTSEQAQRQALLGEFVEETTAAPMLPPQSPREDRRVR